MFVHERIDPNERFRERRRRARRRRRMQRTLVVCALLGVGSALALGATYIGHRGGQRDEGPLLVDKQDFVGVRTVPREMRGVHVTMALASLPGKLYDYLALRSYGLNTIELDVKDENGQIGFVSPDLPALARETG